MRDERRGPVAGVVPAAGTSSRMGVKVALADLDVPEDVESVRARLEGSWSDAR